MALGSSCGRIAVAERHRTALGDRVYPLASFRELWGRRNDIVMRLQTFLRARRPRRLVGCRLLRAKTVIAEGLGCNK